MERLRYVARADGAGVASLVEAAARALAGLGDDYAGLVTGCRQMVDRHPSVGPMWWLTSRMLCGERPRDEAWAVVEALPQSMRLVNHHIGPTDGWRSTICRHPVTSPA